MALALAFVLVAGAVFAPAQAAAETRTLKLYFTHTGERAEITFKRNGRYVRSGLNKLNRFLRDHRRNEPTNMDPELFDLVWEVYQASGARNYIHVVSAYRSPATNAMLRRTRGGQARKSQHTLGKAMDFFIPGVPTRKLRELGFKLQGGGVGYYPKSATPFVHLDTGSVRAWPRMSRSELTRLFPDGKTLHLPPDGRRLPGYQQALAAYNARERSGQPATFGRTRRSGGGSNTERGSSGGGGGNLLANLFGRDNDDSGSASASRPSAPSRRQAAPETPGTALAALSRRDLPRPAAAPRAAPQPVTPAPAPAAPAPAAAAPQAPDAAPAATSTVGLRIPVPRALIPGVRVGDPRPAQPPAAVEPAPAPAPVVVPETQPAPAEPDGPATLLASLTPPVPRDRPSVAIASAEPLTIRQTDPAVETGDQAAALLAAADAQATASTDETPTLLAALPAPAPRPTDAPSVDDPLTQLAAYAPVEPMVPPTRPAPAAAAANDGTTGRGGRIAVPAPRPDRTSEDAALAAALDTGVTTTAKSARPSARDAVTAQPPTVPVVPADQIDPARFGDWTVSVASVTAEGRPTERPEFLRNATRTAPDAVYTAGFSKAPPPDPSRLSGNAVTFLAVARFDGGQGGGDGQPLQLQIPATN